MGVDLRPVILEVRLGLFCAQNLLGRLSPIHFPLAVFVFGHALAVDCAPNLVGNAPDLDEGSGAAERGYAWSFC